MEAEVEREGEPNPKDSDPLLQKKDNSFSCSSDEIKDEEIEAASAACCRICLEHESEPGDFIFLASLMIDSFHFRFFVCLLELLH